MATCDWNAATVDTHIPGGGRTASPVPAHGREVSPPPLPPSSPWPVWLGPGPGGGDAAAAARRNTPFENVKASHGGCFVDGIFLGNKGPWPATKRNRAAAAPRQRPSV